MDVRKIAAGLWRWTGYHEEWKEDVGSVFCETEDGVVLVDPLVPPGECASPESASAASGRAKTPGDCASPESASADSGRAKTPGDAERFWRVLDKDLHRVGGQVHVLVTVFWHVRSTAAIVERYSARVWVPNRSRAAIERRSGSVTDVYRLGERLPGGIEAFRTARAAEVVFWIPRHRALVPGDVLLGDGEGGVRMCPESWLPDKTGHPELAASLRPLLDLPVQRILVSHGEPVLANGRRKLAMALGRP